MDPSSGYLDRSDLSTFQRLDNIRKRHGDKYDAAVQEMIDELEPLMKNGLKAWPCLHFHDGDERQKAIGVTAKGHWDEFANDFVPFE